MYVLFIEIALRGGARGKGRSNWAKGRGPSGSWVQYPNPVVPSIPHHSRWIILARSCTLSDPTLIWAAKSDLRSHWRRGSVTPGPEEGRRWEKDGDGSFVRKCWRNLESSVRVTVGFSENVSKCFKIRTLNCVVHIVNKKKIVVVWERDYRWTFSSLTPPSGQGSKLDIVPFPRIAETTRLAAGGSYTCCMPLYYLAILQAHYKYLFQHPSFILFLNCSH